MRNTPGPIKLVVVHPDFAVAQTYEGDLVGTFARELAKLHDTSTNWDGPQGDGARNRLYLYLKAGGSIQSNSANLTVTTL